MTEPIFVSFLKHNEDLYAIFHFDLSEYPLMPCYSSIGQHSTCQIEYINKSKKAAYNEYNELLKELCRIYKKVNLVTYETIQVHRNPTADEIKKGYGAIHYKEVNLAYFIKKDGNLKKRFKSKDDNLYYKR